MNKIAKNPPIVLIGFGNQAKAWALNLRDSGRSVVIALTPESPSHRLVQEWHLPTIHLGSSQLSSFQHFVFLTPDHTHYQILEQNKNFFPHDATFIYAHGFSVDKHQLTKIYPQWNHLLLAPKAIAGELRFNYETKNKLGAVYSVEFSSSPQEDELFLLQLARDLGINMGPFKTKFQQETYADLFSEQALLCSVLPYVAASCFRYLNQQKLSPELAYLECWHEMKLIVDTMIKLGPQNFFKMISPNALIGSQKGKNLLIDQAFEEKLQRMLKDIVDGTFYAEIDQSSEEHLQQMRKDVHDFWQKEPLQQIFNKMNEGQAS